MGPRFIAPAPATVARADLPLPNPYIAPGTRTEVRLEKIWRTVLMMDRIGVADRYRDLGGDSFSATVIFTMIEETFGANLPLASLADAPTIAELARRIDLAERGEAPGSG